MSRHGVYLYHYDENGKRVESKLPKPPEGEATEKAVEEWDEYMLFTIEPELAAIAIAAATTLMGSITLRSIMFGICLKEADKLVGEDARDPRLRSKAAWDFFNDYLFDLLQL